MLRFLQTLQSYGTQYALRPLDRAKLVAHWPLFRLAQTAQYGRAPAKQVAEGAMRWAEWYEMVHAVRGCTGAPIPVPIRFRTSDLDSFKEIFWGDGYPLPPDCDSIRTVVDAGANIGMAALFFLARCPVERAVLVEANAELLGSLKRNVSGGAASVGADVAIENAFVSGRSGEDIVIRIAKNHRMTSRSDGQSDDGRTVRVKRVGLRDLLEAHGMDTVDLLKMDIEGAEFEVLEEDASVLQKFRHLFVEIHGSASKRTHFVEGVRSLGFVVNRLPTGAPEVCETIYGRRIEP